MPLESRVSLIRPATGRYGRPTEGEELADELHNVMPLIQTPEPVSLKSTASPASDPSHLNAALEMVKRAAQAMDAMEDHARIVQAKAQELAERAHHDVCAAKQQAASLQQRLSESESRAEELDTRLAEAQERARAAHERLTRFQETINAAFTSCETSACAPNDNDLAVTAG
jgi:DNA repair exonuclease SbcCD ATPase subunit